MESKKYTAVASLHELYSLILMKTLLFHFTGEETGPRS